MIHPKKHSLYVVKVLSCFLIQVVFGPTFLGSVPFPSKLHDSIDNVSGFVGCIMELQVNSRELHMMEEAYHGQHIHNCDTTKCQHQPCRNGGTCIRYAISVYPSNGPQPFFRALIRAVPPHYKAVLLSHTQASFSTN